MGWDEDPNISPAPASPAPVRCHRGLLPFSLRRLPPAARTHRGCQMGAAQRREQEAAAERLFAPESDPTRLP